jgi:hypothetical protein
MVRPGSFARNEAAAVSNAFMHRPAAEGKEIARAAQLEFDALSAALSNAGVEVVVEEEPELPDSIFPNNWMSFHQPEGSDPVLITYPMATPLRRLERREDTIERIHHLTGGRLRRVQLEHLEERGEIVEGTGALVIDRVAGVAFGCRSPRATDGALDVWRDVSGFEVVRFDARDRSGLPVYHTNVVMSIGQELAIFVGESVPDGAQRRKVLDRLERLGKRVLDISIAQMGEMCANVLELRTAERGPVIAMSHRAWSGFTSTQRREIERVASVLTAPIPTIETVGGGSARCMIAELGQASL